MGWAVKMDKKGGFYGREALCKEPSRKLIGLTLEGQAIPRQHYKVVSNGQEAGEITSGIFSPTLKKGIALAYVKKEYLDKDLAVDIRGKAVPAKVTEASLGSAYHQTEGASLEINFVRCAGGKHG